MVSTEGVVFPTVTKAEPLRLVAEHEEAVNDAIVYVVVATGLTVTEIGLLAPENAVPSDKVPDHGPFPVTAILRLAVPPVQIEAPPLMVPVGLGTTVMVTDAEFVHPVAATVPVTTYVAVDAGTKATPFVMPPVHAYESAPVPDKVTEEPAQTDVAEAV